MGSLGSIAIEVEFEMNAGEDSRSPGGAVTVALCGHWDHDGPCRWPHSNRMHENSPPAVLRSVVVGPIEDHDEIARRIEDALRNDTRWQVHHFVVGGVAEDERPLVLRLMASRTR